MCVDLVTAGRVAIVTIIFISFYKWKTIYFNLCKLIDILERFSFDTLFETRNFDRLRAFRVEQDDKSKNLCPNPDLYSVCRILKMQNFIGWRRVCVLQAKRREQAKRRMVKLRDPIRSDSKSNKYERVEEENTLTHVVESFAPNGSTKLWN